MICQAGRTGNFGDGMIFVMPVEQICRVRTGECGEAVLIQNNKQPVIKTV
ncbi:MAG: P-II family nitrogen regulator [Dehalococcoidales bacterium]|nr:P-II family nitrogen regulator [Dehalococcoidales bacterium]